MELKLCIGSQIRKFQLMYMYKSRDDPNFANSLVAKLVGIS